MIVIISICQGGFELKSFQQTCCLKEEGREENEDFNKKLNENKLLKVSVCVISDHLI